MLDELARCEDDYASARVYYEQTLEIAERRNSADFKVSLWANLGFVAQHERNYELASQLFHQSLSFSWGTGNRTSVVEGLTGLAGVAGAQGQPERAARLFGAVANIFRATGYHMHLTDQMEYERNLASAHAQLDEATWQAGWEEGYAMSIEEVISYALETSPETSPEQE